MFDINIKDMLSNMLDEIRRSNPKVPAADWDQVYRSIEQEMDNEPPPKIAVIGYTGVGKSSTINALFGTNLPVSHIRAETQIETAIQISARTINGEKGLLTVYDMPGLGESILKQRKHLKTYDRVLADADVAIWILEAHDRATLYALNHLKKEIRAMNPKIIGGVVFALNKVDLVHPGETAWNPDFNLPSPEQELNIKARLYDVQQKVKEALPRWNGTVIAYSVNKRYNLPQLFSVMLDAVPKKRQWVVASRKALANYFELVDPRLLPQDKLASLSLSKRNLEEEIIIKSSSSSRDEIGRVLDKMSEEEYAQIAKTKQGLLDWLKLHGLDS